jgi:hypothetical protein
MSVIRFLLNLFLLIPFFGIIPPIQIEGIFISTDFFGPFSAYQDNVDLTFNISIGKSKSMFSEKFTCGPSAEDIRFSTKTDSHRPTSDLYTFTVNLPTYMLLSPNGMFCKVQVTEEKTGFIQASSFEIKPLTSYHQSIDPSKYITSPYKVYYARYRILGNSITYHQENFQFRDYIDYLNIDTYYRLDLSGVNFTCGPLLDFSYETAYLLISDYQNIFPYLNHDTNHCVQIPLQVVSNSTTKSFKYANYMYVHPKTLEMSLTYRDGFVQTRYFYLPINKKAQMLEERVQIHLLGAGFSKSDITWDLSYLATGNIIGNCSNSDYCIIGGFSSD